jgi:hypothetical protein
VLKQFNFNSDLAVLFNQLGHNYKFVCRIRVRGVEKGKHIFYDYHGYKTSYEQAIKCIMANYDRFGNRLYYATITEINLKLR